MDKDNIIKALTICSNSEKKCDKCIYNRWVSDICQQVLIKDALALVITLEKEIADLKGDVLDVAKEMVDIIGG
jgi:hypothetical protein